MNRFPILLCTAGLLAACGSGSGGVVSIDPTGPPEVSGDVVADHARQFDDEIPEREAGSQEEQIASTYILGHLQQAGYVVRLEAVPVANLVESTDVIARPPSGSAAPARLVAVPYDTAPDGSGDGGAALGLFLELARATRVADPDHDVSFAALGAEHADIGGGHLGSRRLIRLLIDEDANPSVILFGSIATGEQFSATGSEMTGLTSIARDLGIETELEGSISDDPFARAGMPTTIVSGEPEAVGQVLLRFLTGRS